MKFLVVALLALVMGQRAEGSGLRGQSFLFTPVITAAAYAQGDQIGVLQKLANVLPASSATIQLSSWNLVDKAKVDHDLEILLFDHAVTVASADNAAVNVADAEMASGFIGRLRVATADYVDNAACSDVTKETSLLLKGGSNRDLYLLLVCADAGGCDYAAIGDLSLRLTYFQ